MSLANRAVSAIRRLVVYRKVLADVARFRLAPPRDDLVYLDLQDPLFNKRYTYLFVKFLLLTGRSVVLRYRSELVLRFNELKYTKLILDEEGLFVLPFEVESDVSIGDRPGHDKRIHMDWFARDGGTSAYTIPMTQHPLLYRKGTWDDVPEPRERATSVVFSGNVTAAGYRDPAPLDRFGMASRHDQVERIRRASSLDVRDRLEAGGGAGGDAPGGRIDVGVVYLLDRDALGVGVERWRGFLARFRFFLALPGRVMPFCHNVVEALSVGTVPVIHERYAELFTPRLTHLDQVVTYTEETLVDRLAAALALDEADAAAMAERARAYYEEHLVPEAVVRRALSEEVSELRMCGEGDSVRLMEGERR